MIEPYRICSYPVFANLHMVQKRRFFMHRLINYLAPSFCGDT